MIYLAYVLFAVYVITRFGRVITASRALPVWMVLLALGVTVVDPGVLTPIAALFGIQVVSNMVFATLILFLLFESLSGAAEQTKVQRQVRKLVARLAAREFVPLLPLRSGSPRVLVVVPAYNEGESIAGVVEQLVALRSSSTIAIDAVVIDDGSIDDTADVALRAGEGQVAVISHSINCNVGGVLTTGFMIALGHGYDYVVQCDGDGQHPVMQIEELVGVAHTQGVDLLVGSRFIRTAGSDESTTAMRRIGGRLISIALRTFGTHANVSDPTSGFRVYSRRAAQVLVQQMPDEYPEPESIALCAIRHLPVGETPVRMSPRQGGESSISGWKSAIFMIKVLTSLISYRLRFALGRVG